MTDRSRLLRCYPPAWRARYGDDAAAYLDDRYPGRIPLRAAASLVIGGVRERFRTARSDGTSPAPLRVRAGVLQVLVGWAAFVIAGAAFAKGSEHFDAALSAHDRAVPDIAYGTVQVVAIISGVAVLTGLLLAAPAALRFLVDGGWSVIRRHVTRAVTVTTPAVAATIAVLVQAQRLTPPQRNGGDTAYAALFLAWATLVALSIAFWTVAVVATGRQLLLSRQTLLVESRLAIAASCGMLVMLPAAIVWGTTSHSALSPQLLGSLALMSAALIPVTSGVVRIVRSSPV